MLLHGAIFEMDNGEVIVGEMHTLLTTQAAVGGVLHVPPQAIVAMEGDRSRPFYLGKYEVTQGQWHAVMGDNLSHFTGDPTLPVEHASGRAAPAQHLGAV